MPTTPGGPGGRVPLPLSKAAAAYASLRRKIQAGELAPGERVTLNKLAQMEGMSLTPIREALKRLVSEGYAVHDEHVGTRIADLTPARVEQIYRLRRVLEPMAVRLAAQRADDETEHILEDLIRHAEAAATPSSGLRRMSSFTSGSTGSAATSCWSDSSSSCGRACPIRPS
ncbi:GntR family transcriptional regulator [Nesterenkonia pannonica]|uniref:GntR family transcriptional regulator n=1 Tax=Nesterenkonia pannonica TaxID=1548602 RepID=UPI002164A1DC|nr:GntR family transcriptional regulator [Nesterenkonia pannonica]